MLDPFTAALREGWPGADPLPPRFPPVVGALIVATRAVGRNVDAAWLERVEASLPDALP